LKLAKIDKTIKVDPVKMSLFDNTKNIHGMLISEFIDQKLEEFLSIHAPDEMQKIRIQKLRTELSEAEHTLPEIEFMMKQRKSQQKKTVEEVTIPDVDSIFYEKFEEIKTYLANQINRKTIDWKYITETYKFKDRDTAEAIVRGLLKDNSLLGCVACKKWNSKTEYCSTYRKSTDADNTCGNWVKR